MENRFQRGTLCWATGHLLANGDSRSLLFFGGLAIWSGLQMLVLNRRDGPWVKPAPVALWKDMLLLLFGVIVAFVLAWFHPQWFGVAVLPARA